MLLNNADLENICEALHQMEFRCARNIHLLEDSFLSAVDQDSKIELAVLREQLQQYHATMEKIQLLREPGLFKCPSILFDHHFVRESRNCGEKPLCVLAGIPQQVRVLCKIPPYRKTAVVLLHNLQFLIRFITARIKILLPAKQAVYCIPFVLPEKIPLHRYLPYSPFVRFGHQSIPAE